jgi:hypothetical protein
MQRMAFAVTLPDLHASRRMMPHGDLEDVAADFRNTTRRGGMGIR